MPYNSIPYSEYLPMYLRQFRLQDVHLAGHPDDFNGSIDRADLGAIQVFRLNSNFGVRSARKVKVRDLSSATYVLSLLETGSYRLSQHGRAAISHQNGLMIHNTFDPVESAFEDAVDVHTIAIPHRIAEACCPAIIHNCAVAVEADTGCTGMIKDTIRRLWQERSLLSDKERTAMIWVLFRLIEEVFDQSDDKGNASALGFHYARMLRVIEENYFDSDLSVTSLADTLGISQSYVHASARVSGQSVSELIFERRLEEAKRLLGDPAMGHRQIADIAYGTGFKSLSHFSRRFHEAFGHTPRDFRRLVVNELTADE